MIPSEFTGGWVRQGISIDGRPAVEESIVWWLQAPTHHADLRVPEGRTGTLTSFAGTTSWDGAALTWTRLVDLEHFDGADVGTVTWDGPDLMESGTFDDGGCTVAYTERWVRLPASDGPLWALRRGGVRLVRAGDYAITLEDQRSVGGPFLATAWRLVTGRWQTAHTLPGVKLAPPPPLSEDCEGWIPS